MGVMGSAVRHYRLRAGLTQEELAERAGLSVRGLRKLECGGTARPHSATVRKLAGVLGVADPFEIGDPADPLVVVIADHHTRFAGRLGRVLAARARATFRVAGVVTTGDEAVALVGRSGAGLAIVDLTLPPRGGVDVIRRIRDTHPDTQVLALSPNRDVGLAIAALRAGAIGFLVRSATPDALLAPLLTIAAGAGVVQADLLPALLADAQAP